MPKINRLATAMAAISLALAAPLALPAAAQEAQQEAPQTPQMQQAPALTVDDAQLEAFVAALRSVDELERGYSETLQQAETDEEREAIVAEANTAMAEAIENTPGMSLEDYIAILQQAQQDPALSARIMERLDG
jgi:hypothetical protein